MVLSIMYFLLGFLMPTQLGRHFWPDWSFMSGVRIDYLSPTLYVIELVILILVCLQWRKIMAQLSRIKPVYFVVTVLIILAHITLSLRSGVALTHWTLVIGLVLLALSIERNIYLLYGLTVSAIIEVVLVVSQFIQKSALQGPWYWLGERALSLSSPDIAKMALDGAEYLRPYGTFSHPNIMSGFYLLIYFFALTSINISSFSASLFHHRCLSRHPRLRSRISGWCSLRNILLLCSTLLILFSFSRATITIFAAMNIVYFLSRTQLEHRKVIGILLMLVLALAVISLSQIQGDPETLTKRIELTGHAVQVITAYPISGTGLGNYIVAQNYPLQPVHNIFLLGVAEWGIILFAAVIYGAFVLIRRKVVNPYVVAAVVLTGLIDHYWLTQIQTLVLLAVILGWSYADYRAKKSTPDGTI